MTRVHGAQESMLSLHPKVSGVEMEVEEEEEDGVRSTLYPQKLEV